MPQRNQLIARWPSVVLLALLPLAGSRYAIDLHDRGADLRPVRAQPERAGSASRATSRSATPPISRSAATPAPSCSPPIAGPCCLSLPTAVWCCRARGRRGRLFLREADANLLLPCRDARVRHAGVGRRLRKEVTGGDDGFTGINLPAALTNHVNYFYFTLATVAVGIAALWVICHSAFGLTLVAVREQRAHRIHRCRHAAHALGGLHRRRHLGGLCRALFGMYHRGMYIENAYWTESAQVPIMVLLGGMYSFVGRSSAPPRCTCCRSSPTSTRPTGRPCSASSCWSS